eukprot:7389587-Prymnesium_polylepis.4
MNVYITWRAAEGPHKVGRYETARCIVKPLVPPAPNVKRSLPQPSNGQTGAPQDAQTSNGQTRDPGRVRRRATGIDCSWES